MRYQISDDLIINRVSDLSRKIFGCLLRLQMMSYCLCYERESLYQLSSDESTAAMTALLSLPTIALYIAS